MKFILALLGSISLGGPTAVAIANFDSGTLNQKSQTIVDGIQDDILKKSTLINSQTLYNYNNKDYRNFDSIISDELDKNPITLSSTSSDPNKIIKNTTTNELDENLIYSTNKNDFVKVYKNALGKVVLPNCLGDQKNGCVVSDENQIDRSLKSYVNEGLIRPQYSYDGHKWYDSEIEAKNAYKADNYQVKKSLFYYYNGKYYNAFNEADEQKLKAQLTPGYNYAGVSEGLKAKINSKEAKYNFLVNHSFGEKTVFENDFKNAYKSFFMDNIDDIITTNLEYTIILTTGNDDEYFTLKDVNINKNNILISGDNGDNKEGKLGRTIKITISNKYRKNIDLPKMLKQLHTTSDWTRELDKTGGVWSMGTAERKEIFHFNLGKQNDNGNDSYDLILDRDRDAVETSGYESTHPDQIKVDDTKVGVTNFKITLNENNEKNSYSLNNEFNIMNNETLDSKIIISKYANNEGTDITKIIESIAQKTKAINLTQNLKDIIFNYVYEKNQPKFFDSNSQKLIKKDWLYGENQNGNMKFSFLKSEKDFKNVFSNELKNDEPNLIFKDASFKTLKNYWLNNFYYLENDELDSGITLKEMYFVDDSSNPNSFIDFSDPLQNNIASTPQKAEEIKYQNSISILRKSYVVYDINGNAYFSKKNREEVINELKKNISLEYKYINKKEIVKFKDQDKDYENLISSGKFNIFKFKLDNGIYKYYKDYTSALNMYKMQLKFINSVQTKYIETYVYTIILNNQYKNYYYTNLTNINTIAKQVYNDYINNKK